jgi:hypothetical protein
MDRIQVVNPQAFIGAAEVGTKEFLPAEISLLGYAFGAANLKPGRNLVFEIPAVKSFGGECEA